MEKSKELQEYQDYTNKLERIYQELHQRFVNDPRKHGSDSEIPKRHIKRMSLLGKSEKYNVIDHFVYKLRLTLWESGIDESCVEQKIKKFEGVPRPDPYSNKRGETFGYMDKIVCSLRVSVQTNTKQEYRMYASLLQTIIEKIPSGKKELQSIYSKENTLIISDVSYRI